MKKLSEKHLEAIEKQDFWAEKTSQLSTKIKEDTSGACWDIDKSLEFTYQEAQRLDSIPYSERVKQPLWGLSVGMKDLFTIKGLKTTAGSRMLENFISPYDSTVWEDLKSRGALMGAKLAMDEFAMGSYSNTSSFGKVSIPGFPDRTAGGSSGGSGAALAADLVDFTVGSDTGGSVRLPASFCSTVGYKPSYGAFSRFGMIAYASSLDQAGFLTHHIEDVKYLLDTGISHADSRDFTSTGIKSDGVLKNKLTVAYFPSILASEGVSQDVKNSYAKLIEEYRKSSNIEVIDVDIPLMSKAAEIYYIIACSEASSNLARFQGVYFGPKLVEQNFSGNYWEQCAQYRSKFFGEEVQKRIMMGAYISSSENFKLMFGKAQSLRAELKKKLNEVLSKADVIILPTSPSVSPKWDEIAQMSSVQIYMSDFMTVPFSLAGLPAISMPLFKNKEGLGIGMQFVGQQYKDYQLVQDIIRLTEKK